jgi:hypothetical protein
MFNCVKTTTLGDILEPWFFCPVSFSWHGIKMLGNYYFMCHRDFSPLFMLEDSKNTFFLSAATPTPALQSNWSAVSCTAYGSIGKKGTIVTLSLVKIG